MKISTGEPRHESHSYKSESSDGSDWRDLLLSVQSGSNIIDQLLSDSNIIGDDGGGAGELGGGKGSFQNVSVDLRKMGTSEADESNQSGTSNFFSKTGNLLK